LIFKTEKREAASVNENLAQTGIVPRAALQQCAHYFIDEFIFWSIRRFITTLPRKKSIRAGKGANALSGR
jgi:hypothetical protein